MTSGTPAGTYTLVYQICQNSTPSNCDTATVTVNVCQLASPILIPVECSDPVGNLTITNLPAEGSWTLNLKRNNSVVATINGAGPTYNATGLTSGGYQAQVIASGCTSAYSSTQEVGYFNNALSADMTGVYVDQNSDGLVNLGDKISYQFTVTNNTACDMVDLHIIGSDITASALPLTIPALQTVEFSGEYFIVQSDINNGVVTEFAGLEGDVNGYSAYVKAIATVPLTSSNGGLTFIAFFDENQNGTKEDNEEIYTNGVFSYQLNSGPMHFSSSDSGIFTIHETNIENTFTVGFGIYGFCSGAYIMNPAQYQSVSATGSGYTTHYFAITAVACADLEIFVSSGVPRPGMPWTQTVFYYNYGTAPAAGTITYDADPLVTISGVSQPEAVINGNQVTYDFIGLNPGEFSSFNIVLDVPSSPIVNFGDILSTEASITILPGETNPTNNMHIVNSLVMNSYDPNDITESHGPQIAISNFGANEELIYTVRFENTGTADALDIRVDQILDGKLDADSFRMLASSHAYTTDRIGSDVSVYFDDINLPPSQAGSDVGKGFFVFAVKPLPGFQAGDMIQAVADIYFDSNPAIVTNVWETEFVTSLAMLENHAGNFIVWPNPTLGDISVSADQIIDNVSVFDVTGKLLLNVSPSSETLQLDLSDFAKGLYFVEVESRSGSRATRIIKQ